MQNRLTQTLCHHGIMGQKWGVRRFQPYPKNYSGDGKFTGEHVKRALKKRHEAIAEATLAGKVRKSAAKSYAKANAKYLVKNTEESRQKVESSKKEFEYWNENYKRAEQKALDRVKTLQKKYGKTLIKDVPYKDSTVSGKVFTTKQILGRSLASIGLVGAGLVLPGLGSEMALLTVPSKTIAAKNYKVRLQRERGLGQKSAIEKGLNSAQIIGDTAKNEGIKSAMQKAAQEAKDLVPKKKR